MWSKAFDTFHKPGSRQVAIPAVNMKLRGITLLYNDSLAIYGVVSHNGYFYIMNGKKLNSLKRCVRTTVINSQN